MEYVKRILKAVVFAAGLFGLLVLSGAVFLPKNNTKEAGMEETQANGILGEKSNTVDILILGDSESISSIRPRKLWEETGYTLYICGTAGQQLGYTDTMLRRAFRNQSPKMVLLDAHILYNHQTLEDAAYLKICEDLTVFRYHDRWKSLTSKDLHLVPDYTRIDGAKGYHTSFSIISADGREYMLPTDKADPIPELNRFCVRRIKEFCDKNGAKLILVSSPSPVNWNMEKHNAVQQLADDLSCEYLDMNLMTEEIPIDWSNDTRDGGDHLNNYGASKVTAYMSEYFTGTGLLTDHRDDPAYAGWDDDW